MRKLDFPIIPHGIMTAICGEYADAVVEVR